MSFVVALILNKCNFKYYIIDFFNCFSAILSQVRQNTSTVDKLNIVLPAISLAFHLKNISIDICYLLFTKNEYKSFGICQSFTVNHILQENRLNYNTI